MNYIGAFLFTVLSVLLAYLAWKKLRKDKEACEGDENEDESEGIENKSPPLDVPKGPISLPLIGNLIQLGDRPHEKMMKWVKTYGPIYQLYLGSQLVVVLNGTRLVREALVDQGEIFAGRPQLYMIHATLKGKGIISSPYNQDFNEHKRFLINTINKFGRRRSSLEVNCLQTIRETLDSYRESIDHNFEYTNNHIKNHISQITSQNVLTMTFGRRMYDENTFRRLMDLITENFQNTAVAAAFNFIPITRIFKRYILKNVMRATDFLNDLVSEKMEEYHDEFDEEEHINDGEKESNRRVATSAESNIIECYLRELMNNSSMLLNEHTVKLSSSASSLYEMQSRKLTERRRSSLGPEMRKAEEMLRRRRSRYNSFSFDHLSSLVQDLFIAGTETISLTLNWAIIYAAYYPECQQKIANEIDRVLGQERLPTESIRPKLPYVEAFINETMRFHCAGPILIPRSTTRDAVLRGYHIPADTFIMVNMWTCMRDEEYWNEPEKFDPTRFIDKNGLYKCKNDAMMPFSIGKRACIGESIARLQLFLIFTSLMQKFSFEFASSKDIGNEKILKGISGIGLSPPNVRLRLRIR